MNAELAKLAIEIAVAGAIASLGTLLGAAANWLNTRTRLMEQQLQISDLQRQTTHLAAVQQVQGVLQGPPPPP